MNSYRLEPGKSEAEVIRQKTRDARFRKAEFMRRSWTKTQIQNEERRLADEVAAMLKLRAKQQEDTPTQENLN